LFREDRAGSRAMLRRPSDSPSIGREEGCSSTAFAVITAALRFDWNDHAGRDPNRSAAVITAALP